VLIQANTTNSASYANFPGGIGNDQLRFREAFVQAGNVIKSNPDAKFWAGDRFYRRYQIDIDDFYILDMSGHGAGVEDFNLKFAKLSAAFLAGARPDIVTDVVPIRQHRYQALRHEGTGRTSSVWFNYAIAKGGTQNGTVIPTTDGWGLGFRHSRTGFGGSMNLLSGTRRARPVTSALLTTNPISNTRRDC
jgi:maltoporin